MQLASLTSIISLAIFQRRILPTDLQSIGLVILGFVREVTNSRKVLIVKHASLFLLNELLFEIAQYMAQLEWPILQVIIYILENSKY